VCVSVGKERPGMSDERERDIEGSKGVSVCQCREEE